jgi:hypothetical protein
MKPHLKQQGMALIMLMFIVGLAATSYLLHALNPDVMRIEQDKKTAVIMAEAKAALIGRAVKDSNRPGSLPCPDGNGDGSSDLFSGPYCPTYIGRYPWKTLGTGMLRAGFGETLWYALSSNYRDNPPINGSLEGELSVDGVGDMVAVIFSAGPALGVQTTRPSNSVADYLEGENSNGDGLYSNVIDQNKNDKLLAISRTELMRSVEKLVLGEAVNVLTEYYTHPAHPFFPYPASESDGECDTLLLNTGYIPITGSMSNCPHQLPNMPAWFTANAWSSRVHYEVATACVKATPNCGGTGYITDGAFTDVRVRLVSVGSGQKRIIR